MDKLDQSIGQKISSFEEDLAKARDPKSKKTKKSKQQLVGPDSVNIQVLETRPGPVPGR